MFENVCFTLDSTECPIRRPRGAFFLDNLLFSEKADSHTVKYELVTHPATGMIIWAYGGMHGSLHDSRLLATSGFLRLLHGNEKGVVDKGYIGIDPLRLVVQVKSPSTIHELVWNHCIGSASCGRTNQQPTETSRNVLQAISRNRLEHAETTSSICARCKTYSRNYRPYVENFILCYEAARCDRQCGNSCSV